MFDEPVIEISTKKVTTVTPDTSIAKAIGIMEKSNFHNLIVFDSATIYMVNIQDLLLASNPESHVDAFMFRPHCSPVRLSHQWLAYPCAYSAA